MPPCTRVLRPIQNFKGWPYPSEGVLHRSQFGTLGVTRGFVAAQIAAGRWMPVGHKVVLLQNAPPTREQLMQIAVLDAESSGCSRLPYRVGTGWIHRVRQGGW